MNDYDKETIKTIHKERKTKRFINIFKYTEMQNNTIETMDMLFIWQSYKNPLVHRVYLTLQE